MFRKISGRQNAPFHIAILIALVSLLVSACGNSNDFNQASGSSNNNPSQAYVGRYLGANNLDAGQTSVLDLTVASNGQAVGTMQVSSPTVSTQGFTIAPGLYDLTGNVDLSTGTFSLSGNLPGVGAVSFAGTLPLGNNQSSYVATINGQTFNGVVQNANLGTPTPPSGGTTGTTTTGGATTTGGTTGTTTTGGTGTTGGTTGATTTGTGGGTGESNAIFGGALTNFTFTPGPNYNGVNPPVTASSLITGAVLNGSATDNSASISISETSVSQQGAQIRALVLSVVTKNGESLVAGRTYQLADASGQGAVISLSESTGVVVNRAWTLDANTTGTITITSLTSSNIEMDFEFSSVGPNSGVANNPATGSFATSGHVLGNFAPKP